ncbi:MAG: class I SAM-dependent methyltransferase [Rubrivivax sp.]|nr:class I SAM-dependent methyltransferase [Pyrinomonadaceae bacterium]
MRRPLGDLRRRFRALSARTRLQKKRLLEDPSLASWERELLSKAEGAIHYNDGMYTGDSVRYYRVGLSAIRSIDEAVRRASLKDVRNILDLPSGGGRVLRYLPVRFPRARVTACDLQRDAVDFCARTFGATPAYSVPDFDKLFLDARFDLIWCGSLVTHLNQKDIAALLEFFKRHLAPAGLLVFTTMGDHVARERLPRREFDYGLADGQIRAVADEYAQSGFGFAGYPEGSYDISQTCGVTLTSPEWIRGRVRQAGGLSEVYFAARGWDDHQDVFGFVREV